MNISISLRKSLANSLIATLMMLALSNCKTTPPTSSTTDFPDATEDANSIDFLNYEAEEEVEIPVWAAKRGPYRPSATKKFELIHTKLQVSFDWEKRHLHGKAFLTMRPYFYPQQKVVLDAKGFDIHRVAKVILTDTTDLSYQYDSLTLTIDLEKQYTDTDRFDLYVSYTAKPEELPKGGSQAITSDQGLYFINPTGTEPRKPRQIWTQGETQANSCWFPTFDSPNMKTTQEIYITVDTAFTTLSNGLLVSQQQNPDGTRTDYWKMDKPHAPYLVMMAIGEYAVVKDEWEGKEVSYYVEPEYAQYARSIFGKTPEMLSFFSEAFGIKYPWDKYAQVVVRDFVSGAMENTTASVFMEELQVDDRYLLDDDWEGIIAHELSHHWFGNMVTCESWAHLPLNESFANYAEYLWLEYKYGKDEADLLWADELENYLYEAKTKQEPMIRYYYTDREDMFDSHSYSKGCLLLHLLRNYTGDRAFFASLKLYLQRNAFKTAEIHDLRLAFEEVTGEDLNWFFNQWFMEAGHPQLTVSESYDPEAKQVYLKVFQQQDSLYTPIYDFPVVVDIWVNGKKERHQIRISQHKQDFYFAAAEKPSLVLFDALNVLPCHVDHIKSTAAFIFQYRNAATMLAQKEALEQLQTGMDEPGIPEVFLEALQDNFWALRELAADAFTQYEGPLKEQAEAALRKIALEDPKSLVRATALQTLISLGNHLDVVTKALNDSSYAVLGSAIFGYVLMGGEQPLEKLASFEAYEDLSIVAILSDFYSYYNIPDKLVWMMAKIDNQSSQGQQILLNYMGSYLLQQPEDQKAQGIDYLEEKALNHKNYRVRVAAFQSMMLLNETEGVNERLKAIIEQETDAQAIAYYQSMGLF